MVIIIFVNLISWEIILFSLITIIIILLKFPQINYSEFIFTSGLQINNRSFLLFLLCILSFIWANMCMRTFYINNSKNSLLILNLRLLIFLIIFFFSSESINLYIIFELSVLPIFSIIIGWGYQTERLEARIRLIFYTIRASLPLLGIYLWIYSSIMTNKLLLLDKIINLNNSMLNKLM